MGLQELLTVIGSSGTVGAIIVVAIRYATHAVEKLYTDMKEIQSKQLLSAMRREEKLMSYLESKTDYDMEVASTLKNICKELTCISERLQSLEDGTSGYKEMGK